MASVSDSPHFTPIVVLAWERFPLYQMLSSMSSSLLLVVVVVVVVVVVGCCRCRRRCCWSLSVSSSSLLLVVVVVVVVTCWRRRRCCWLLVLGLMTDYDPALDFWTSAYLGPKSFTIVYDSFVTSSLFTIVYDLRPRSSPWQPHCHHCPSPTCRWHDASIARPGTKIAPASS